MVSGLFSFMKTITLGGLGGKHYALVDDEDYDRVNQISWTCVRRGKRLYAKHDSRGPYMHRFILNLTAGQICDHRNHNGIDNQKKNLRLCTNAQNNRNQRPGRKQIKTSKYKGVYFSDGYWKFQITYNRQKIGTSVPNEHVAALMYDFWATYLFGEYACTNFKIVAHSGAEEILRA